MGRTYRKRKRKCREKMYRTLGSSHCFVELTRWMKQRGWEPVCSLTLVQFFDTGRGLITKETISKDKVIVSIPVELFITVSTVATSDIGWLFKTNCNEYFFTQQVLATFLVWEKHLGQHSVWREYINTLPADYSLPLLCSEEELSILPTFLSEQILKQELDCRCGFDVVKRLLEVTTYHCNHCGKTLNEVFNYKEYKWSWCTVNSRCVYIDENFCTHDIRLKDKGSLALIPYLDMFNHSDDARVQVGLSANKKFYEIKTLVPFSKYSQVFIHYGHHSNLKLCTDYGFILPYNCQDFVLFSFEEVLTCIQNQREIQNKGMKVKFLKAHSLTNSLSCNSEDLSFNIKAAIYVLLTSERKKKITQKIYSWQFNQQEREMIYNIGKQLIQQKCLEFKNTLKAMDKKIDCGCSKNFVVAHHLMLQYLNILANCIDTITSASILA